MKNKVLYIKVSGYWKINIWKAFSQKNFNYFVRNPLNLEKLIFFNLTKIYLAILKI